MEILGRLLFLYLLFSVNRNITPQQYFHEQINGGTHTTKDLIRYLRQYNPETVTDMLTAVQSMLRTLIAPQKRGLVIAVDEAQLAITNILPRRSISPKTFVEKHKISSNMGGLIANHLLGFFTPLLSTLGTIPATIVVLGTSLSLQDVERVMPAIGKEDEGFMNIVNFPRFDIHDMRQLLSTLLVISDSDLPPDKDLRMLTGRTRFTMSIVGRLLDEGHSKGGNKKQRLRRSFDSALGKSRNQVRKKANELLHYGANKHTVELLSRMVLSFILQAGRTSFDNDSDVDLVQSTLCGLTPESDGLHYIMDEPLVINAVEAELRESNIDPEFIEYSEQFQRILENLGVQPIQPTAK
ncbi:hypothetical protein BGZ76_010814 [Entomortierella beljakovae]|nr:hypothetical protein BGZ76_010814 [Entomortierella beljakovae]